MNEDFVSYELAVKLKAAGFDEPCYSKWVVEPAGKPFLVGSCLAGFVSSECKGRDVLAPFIWQAQKWLREEWGIVVSVHPESKFLKDERIYKHTGWDYSIIRINKNGIMASGPIGHVLMAKYEQALSAGISATLELIKEGE